MTGGEDHTPRQVPRWPLLLIALPAFVAIWSGWVGLGRLTGFGPVVLLPGIADEWVIDSAITLPIGVEAYAAFAMWVWLAPDDAHLSTAARRFACWSSVGALVLGMAGQVAYHLMAAAEMRVAPWQITAFVACLPVAVVGCAAALVHLKNHTNGATAAEAAPVEVDEVEEPVVEETPEETPEERPAPDPAKVDEHGTSLAWKTAPVATLAAVPAPKPTPAPLSARARVSSDLDEQDRPSYRDPSLPLEKRIDLAIAAELAAGKNPPGQRRLAELTGATRARVRTVLERRDAAAGNNGHRLVASA